MIKVKYLIFALILIPIVYFPSIYAQLDENNTSKWLKFSLSQDAEVTFRISASGSLNIGWVYLYRSDKSYYISSVYVGRGKDFGPFGLRKGTYWLKVSRDSGSGSAKIDPIVNPTSYRNDREKNDSLETPTLGYVGSNEGHLGYTDGYETDNVDWWKFSLEKDGKVYLQFSADSTLAIGWVYLYRRDGDYYIASQFVGSDLKKLGPVGLMAGEYLIKVTKDSGYGGYQLNIVHEEQEIGNDSEPNEEVKDAKLCTVNEWNDGHLGYTDGYKTDNVDWWKMNLDKDGEFYIQFSSDKNLAIGWVYLYRKEGDYYITSQFVGSDLKKLGPVGLMAGEYLIKVTKDSGYGGYRMKPIFEANSYENDGEPNDNSSKASQGYVNTWLEGHLGYTNGYKTDNTDWWRFQISSKGKVSFVVRPHGKLRVGWCYLYDSKGSSYYYSMYVGDKEKESEVKELEPGTYLVKVTRDGGYGGYELYVKGPGGVARPKPKPIKPKPIKPVKPSGGLSGYLDSQKDKVWLRYDLSQDAEVTFHISTLGDLSLGYVYLYRSDKTSYISSVYVGQGKDLGPVGLKRGTYWLEVNRSSGSGSFSIRPTVVYPSFSGEKENNDSVEKAIIGKIGYNEGHLGYTDGYETDEKDWWRFKIDEDGEISIQFEMDKTLSMSYVYLYRKDGNSYISSWDVEQKDKEFGPVGLKAGEYLIEINRGSGYGGYKLNIIYKPQKVSNDTEPNEDFAKATKAVIGTNEGHLGYTDGYETDEKDWWKFSVKKDGKFWIQFDMDETLSLSYVYLYRKGGDSYISSWYIGQKGEKFGPVGLKAGEYLIEVNRSNGYGGYYLTIDFEENPYGNDPEPNDEPVNASIAPVNETVYGHLGYTDGYETDEKDWWKFEIGAEGEVSFRVEPLDDLSLSYCYLYDSRASSYYKSIYVGKEAKTSDKVTLKPGTYYIEINRSSGYGAYKLHIYGPKAQALPRPKPLKPIKPKPVTELPKGFTDITAENNWIPIGTVSFEAVGIVVGDDIGDDPNDTDGDGNTISEGKDFDAIVSNEEFTPPITVIWNARWPMSEKEYQNMGLMSTEKGFFIGFITDPTERKIYVYVYGEEGKSEVKEVTNLDYDGYVDGTFKIVWNSDGSAVFYVNDEKVYESTLRIKIPMNIYLDTYEHPGFLKWIGYKKEGVAVLPKPRPVKKTVTYNWKWSSPEPNNWYRIEGNKITIYAVPGSDIWNCERRKAPMLVVDIPDKDRWEVSVHFEMPKRVLNTHVGLVLWNGKESGKVYAVYFGPKDQNNIAIEGSYSRICGGWAPFMILIPDTEGDFIRNYPYKTGWLKIKAVENEYSFFYREPGSEDWEFLGKIVTNPHEFTKVGLIAKAWFLNSVKVTFSDFKIEW